MVMIRAEMTMGQALVLVPTSLNLLPKNAKMMMTAKAGASFNQPLDFKNEH